MGNPDPIPESDTRNVKVFSTNSTNVPLLSLLREFRYRNSTEPRDKIFRLLNVAASFGNRVPFVLNYGMDVSLLFQQVAIYLFKEIAYFWPTYRDIYRNADSGLPS